MTTITIHEILVSLKEYLDCMLDYAMMENIRVVLDTVKKDKETEEGDLVITLLRIEEETSRKPQNVYYRQEKNVTKPTSPDLDINLEVLISAPTAKYETALVLISKVISILNSIKTVSKPEDLEDKYFQIINSMNISLMGMSFDQMLSMWQTLGGTLVPAVAYKIRMLTIPGLTDADTLHVVGEGQLRIDIGRMDQEGAVSPSLTEQEKSKMKEALKMKKEQEEYALQVAEQEAGKSEEESQDNDRRIMVQIKEKKY